MTWLRTLLIMAVARPLAKLMTGADVIGRANLPVRGPAITLVMKRLLSTQFTARICALVPFSAA